MTRQDAFYKWLLYGLALIPIWFLDVFVLSRFPVFGVVPMLLPVAAITVGVLEGALAGAGFGLAMGILCSAVYPGAGSAMIFGLCLLSWLSGAAAQYMLNQNFGGCLLCCLFGLSAIDAGRVALLLLRQQAQLADLLAIALPEVLYSLCFVCIIYPWYAMVRKKVIRFLRL